MGDINSQFCFNNYNHCLSAPVRRAELRKVSKIKPSSSVTVLEVKWRVRWKKGLSDKMWSDKMWKFLFLYLLNITVQFDIFTVEDSVLNWLSKGAQIKGNTGRLSHNEAKLDSAYMLLDSIYNLRNFHR